MRRRCLSLLIALLSLWAAACSSGVTSSARSRYNHGIDLLAEGDLEHAEKAFLDARNDAHGDQMLRYSSAYNLGMLHVRKADDAEISAPQDALKELQQAQQWFQDAARVRSDDEDARTNLELVGRRAQVLADQINKGKNSLEGRLDRVIDDERGLRDQVRKLMEAVQAAKAEADPIAFRENFGTLATTERTLMAEAGSISDLAADELALLDQQKPEEMQQQDKVRQAQLRNLDSYLQNARVAIDDTRRALRKLDGERAHSRATAALALLKRAREQLLDPVAALKGIAQDQNLLLTHTTGRLTLGKKELEIGKDANKPKPEASAVPVWLSPAHLAEREGDALDRTSEVLARFEAAANAPPPADPSKVDPKTSRALKMAGEAVPFLKSSVAAMQKARDALEGDGMQLAQEQELEALKNLLRAIEYFSDLRQLIELSYGEHQGVMAMIDPGAAQDSEALQKLSADQRAQEAFDANSRDVDRLERMTALIAEAKAQAVQQAQAQAAQAQQQGGQAPAAAPGSPDPAAAAGQMYDMAESLRAAAAEEIGTLDTELQAIRMGGKAPAAEQAPLAVAARANSKLEELRRLFYTIVEHLKELHRNQSETYDQTGTAQAAESDEERAAQLPLLSGSQKEHATMAEAIAQALEKQSDAASASGQPNAAEEGEKFAKAAAEVRAALESMNAAANTLEQARTDSASMSVDLSPALDEQPKAIDHLAQAIAILEPPKDQDKKQDQQKQDQKDQDDKNKDQKQDQKQQQQEVSKQQAERRLQEIRDREAERQREREKAQQAQGGSVDKDW